MPKNWDTELDRDREDRPNENADRRWREMEQGGESWRAESGQRGSDRTNRDDGGERWRSDDRGSRGGEARGRWNEQTGGGNRGMAQDRWRGGDRDDQLRDRGGRGGWYDLDNGRVQLGGTPRGGQHAGRGPKGYQRSDARIEEEVNDCLTDDDQVDATNIEVKVENGEVTLTGSVQDRNQKRAAEDAIERVRGVRDIHNQVKVQRADTANTASEGKNRGNQPQRATMAGTSDQDQNGRSKAKNA
jgi:hypothetical protein